MWTLTVISDKTCFSDVFWWRTLATGGLILENMSNIEETLRKMEARVAIFGPITRLNLSGHSDGETGIRFKNESESFDLGSLNARDQMRLKRLLAEYREVVMWSCQAASTEVKCRQLQRIAEDYQVSIKGYSGNVKPGPNVGGGVDRIIQKYFIKGGGVDQWREFKPTPSLRAPAQTTDGPEARILTGRSLSKPFFPNNPFMMPYGY
jgi:predicted nucleotidyltransferase